MISRNTLITLAFALLAIGLQAQTTTNHDKLLELSERFKQRHIIRKAEAKEYANSKGVPMRHVTSNGNVFELQFIDNNRPVYYETHNTNAGITVRVDHLWNGGSLGLNLDGSTYQGLALWDEAGVRTSHQEFFNTGTSRVTQMDLPLPATLSDHSTHIAGTMVASGVDPDARGMAYNGNLSAWDWDGDEGEIAAAAANGIEISNHSYGFAHGWSYNAWYGDKKVSRKEDYWFGFYSGHTQELDEIAYNAPSYLYVKSAGNDRDDDGDGPFPPDGNQGTGYDCIGTRAVAKNILTVGSIDDMPVYEGPASVIMTPYSSWGPVDDGRIKPDIVTNGSILHSSIATGDQDYGLYDGTSMATASASGTLALLQEHYNNLYGVSMLAATLKALVIHTADEAGPDPGPDYMFGWGLLNAEAAAEKISENNGAASPVIEELILTNTDVITREIVLDGTQDLTVTICWTDPAGTPVAADLDPLDAMLVNDLDLSIIGPSDTYYPWKLDRDNPSAPANKTAKNYVDNVETVHMASGPSGTYTIQINHDGTLTGDQAFSMIITVGNAATPDYCESYGVSTNEWIQSVDFADLLLVDDGSDKDGYQDNTTTTTFDVIVNNDYPISLTPGFTGRSTFEYWAVYIDFNGDKDFDDDGELVLTTSKTKSVVSENISIPDIDPIETRMRISMSNTGTPGPCEMFAFGEVEDYTINITGTPPATEYCESAGLDYSLEWIESVTIGTVSSNTGGPPTSGYIHFPDILMDIEENVTYDIILDPGFPKKVQRQFWRVWIDLNGDLDFDDADELVFSADNIRGTASGIISVPVITSITSRMRVAMSRGVAPDDCGPIDYGEVEDYTVNLIAAPSGGSKSGIVEEENTFISPELTIYPNPTDNILNINFTGEVDDTNIMIYNIQGSVVQTLKLNSHHTSLDISELTPGIYYLSLNTGTRLLYKKLIKK